METTEADVKVSRPAPEVIGFVGPGTAAIRSGRGGSSRESGRPPAQRGVPARFNRVGKGWTTPEPPSSLVRWGLLILALVVGSTSLWLVTRILVRADYRSIAAAIRTLPRQGIWLAGLLTILSYLVLTTYDWLALRYVGSRIAVLRSALASFIAFAFSQSLGVSALTGASVRYRFWSLWGLEPGDIARGVAFTSASFWLGAIAAAGVALVAAPATLWTRPVHPPVVGVILLLVVGAYLVWAMRSTPVIQVGRWQLRPPGARLAVAQILTALLDWSLAAMVLWVLLPRGMAPPFHVLVAWFIIAQVAGVASHVPGGVGVFEAVMLVQLRATTLPAQAMAALLAFRAIYYLAPLGVAVLALAAHELQHRRQVVISAARTVGGLVASSTPWWLSGTTFAAGLVLLASGSTPGIHGRLRWLDAFLPLAVMETSHFAASVVGVALLFVANGLRRRLDAAWHIAVALLSVGMVASLLKGGDYEEAASLAVVLVALVPARRHFYRRAALFAEPLSAEWIAAVALAVGATTWLGFFSYRHVAFRGDLWWHFAVSADAPRFLRATVGVAVALLSYGIWRLIGPNRSGHQAPTVADRARARIIAGEVPRADAALAQLGDKALLFSDSGRGFIMYGVHRRAWVALGGPVAPPAEALDLAESFCELADANGGFPVFYQVGPGDLPMFLDLGMTLWKLGESARVPLQGFNLDGGGRKWLRRALREGERGGLSLQLVEPPHSSALLDAVGEVSANWLNHRRTREKGFSLGYADRDYLAGSALALVWLDDRLVAFANVWRSGGGEEMSVDLMRYRDDAPHGVMDFLFGRLLLIGQTQGYRWFNLGMAPLSGMDSRSRPSLWSRVGTLLFRHGEHFYNFRGLRQYKEKFDPVWVPMYLALPGPWALPSALAGVAALSSRGLAGVIAR